jgi:hypothetical protein
MKTPFFGLSSSAYTKGLQPSCALNRSNVAVEVHKSEKHDTLWWTLGSVNGTELEWTGFGATSEDGKEPDVGLHPSVALSDDGTVLEVHESPKGNLWYWHGRITGNKIAWSEERHKQWGVGTEPSVALRADGMIVAVHLRSKDIRWTTGRLTSTSVEWGKTESIPDASGAHPTVTLFGDTAVVVYEVDGTLHYCVGRVQRDLSIQWTKPQSSYQSGQCPSVALADEQTLFEVHQGFKGEVWQMVGVVQDTEIRWESIFQRNKLSLRFDVGARPRVATNGSRAIQVHETQDIGPYSPHGLFSTACLVTERATWMSADPSLATRTLKQLTMPATHDSAMYTGGDDDSSTNQDLCIYGQLMSGCRYFDLRVCYKRSERRFYVYHANDLGQPLSDILDQIYDFFVPDARREVAIFNMSDGNNGTPEGCETFDHFDAQRIAELCSAISSVVGEILYKDGNGEARIALTQRPLKDLTGEKGTAIFTLRGKTPVMKGFYASATAGSDTAKLARASLRVWDGWSDENSHAEKVACDLGETVESRWSGIPKHLPNGQLWKMQEYDGYIYPKPDQTLRSRIGADLLSLLWTITTSHLWTDSRPLNRMLGERMAKTPLYNHAGQMINLLSLDYVQYARALDIALVRNGMAATFDEAGAVPDGEYFKCARPGIEQLCLAEKADNGPPIVTRLADDDLQYWRVLPAALTACSETKAPAKAKRFLNFHTGLCLTADGGSVVMRSYDGREDQQWFLWEAEDGGFAIRKAHGSETCLEADGTTLRLARYTGSRNQIWAKLLP